MSTGDDPRLSAEQRTARGLVMSAVVLAAVLVVVAVGGGLALMVFALTSGAEMEPPATTLPPPGEVTRGEELASDPVDGSTPTDEGTEEPVSDARATPPSGGGPGDVQPTRLAGTAELSGEHQAVQSVMNHHLGRIQHCYTTELRNRPDLAGRIEFELHVDAEGAVSQVLATSSTFEDPAVEQCLVPVLSELRFPGLGETTFTYPFIFQSQ